jgi:hypothetical protein
VSKKKVLTLTSPKDDLHPATRMWYEPAIGPSEVEPLTEHTVEQVAQLAHHFYNLAYWGKGQRVLSRREVYLLRVKRKLDPFFKVKASGPALIAASDYAAQALSTPQTLNFRVELGYFQDFDGNWKWVLFRDGKPPKGAPEANLAFVALSIDLSAILIDTLQEIAAAGHQAAIDVLAEAGIPLVKRSVRGGVSADFGALVAEGEAGDPEPRIEDRGAIARRIIAELAPRPEG